MFAPGFGCIKFLKIPKNFYACAELHLTPSWAKRAVYKDPHACAELHLTPSCRDGGRGMVLGGLKSPCPPSCRRDPDPHFRSVRIKEHVLLLFLMFFGRLAPRESSPDPVRPRLPHSRPHSTDPGLQLLQPVCFLAGHNRASGFILTK